MYFFSIICFIAVLCNSRDTCFNKCNISNQLIFKECFFCNMHVTHYQNPFSKYVAEYKKSEG